jgi:hypothetical protein
MSSFKKRLGADESYQRPKKTFQEQLTAEEIEEKLQSYVKVDDISEVPLNTHIRYFSKNDRGEYVYRSGGFLHRKNDERYVILTNGKASWSVQVANTIFYRKLSQVEEMDALKESFQKELLKHKTLIKKLKKKIDELEAELQDLRPARKTSKTKK